MADGQVVFEIVGDPKGINQTVKQVTNNIQAESKKWDQAASQATGDIEKSFASMAGNIVGKLVAAGIGAIVLNWGKAALEAASDLAEVQNVVDTVFGTGARQIENWAKTAGEKFGLTETQAKKFTSTLGAMMKSSGLAGDEIVTMSTDLAGLAADMASFYNLDFETAFEKIRSGISGETMPLKQLGINMSVANLEAFALAQGLEKTFQQMDQGEQTMLRYQYIMQATADAQGDFEKTSDGFANAQRRITTALDTISTVAGTFILTTIEPLVGGIASFLEKITATPERTVLDDFNDIEVDTTQKMADLEATYNKAQDIIKLLEEISSQTVTLKDGSTITFEELFADIGNLEQNGGNVREYLESLGLDVDYIILKYNVWKESTRQLTALVPSLTSVINSETGAIDDGTEAIQRNLDEWKKAEEKKLAWTAYYLKARALEEKKAEFYKYEFDAGAARTAVERVKKALGEAYGEETVNYAIEWIKTHGTENAEALINVAHIGNPNFAGMALKDAAELVSALKKEQEATKTLEKQTKDYSEAEQALADGKQALIDKYGEEEDAAGSLDGTVTALVDDMTLLGKAMSGDEKAAKELKTAYEKAGSALQAVNDYYQKIRDSVEQSVNSTLKGFEKITTAYSDLDQQSRELAENEKEILNQYSAVWNKWGSNNEALKAMKAFVDAGGELTDTEREAYEALVKVRNAQNEVNESVKQYQPEGMKESLQSQIQFMEEYLNNLAQLKEWGVSDEMISQLSDGTKESAAYLQGLVAGGKEEAQQVGEMFDEVAAKKQQFTDTLTNTKIKTDETFDDLVNTAIEAIKELDLYDEAKESLKQTVQGIADGIGDQLPGVTSAIDAIIEQLDRLNKYGMEFNILGADGNLFTWFTYPGSYETGLDYVPRDNFPAFLHEGEGILTKEENAVWQSFKNSRPASVDYDALGGIMRDNVKAGGDVYLDGRTVGQVVSGIQGRSYRNLQRSGWQG